MRLSYLIFFSLTLFNSLSLAETINIKYEVSVKAMFIEGSLGNIDAKLLLNKDNYNFNIKIKSDDYKLFQLLGIKKVDSNGFSKGVFDLEENLSSIEYEYTQKKQDITKVTNITFENRNVINVYMNPGYDKNKVSKVDDEKLKDVIDPITAFIILSDYELNGQCSKNLNVYDGKRRYELNFTKLVAVDDQIHCTVKRVKIGGFRKKEKILSPPDEINLIFNKDYNIVKEINSKRGLFNFKITVSML